jgi:hypothetical protein
MDCRGAGAEDVFLRLDDRLEYAVIQSLHGIDQAMTVHLVGTGYVCCTLYKYHWKYAILFLTLTRITSSLICKLCAAALPVII